MPKRSGQSQARVARVLIGAGDSKKNSGYCKKSTSGRKKWGPYHS